MPECRAPSSVGSTTIAFLLNVDAVSNEARPIECTPWPQPKQGFSLQNVKVFYCKNQEVACNILKKVNDLKMSWWDEAREGVGPKPWAS